MALCVLENRAVAGTCVRYILCVREERADALVDLLRVVAGQPSRSVKTRVETVGKVAEEDRGAALVDVREMSRCPGYGLPEIHQLSLHHRANESGGPEA